MKHFKQISTLCSLHNRSEHANKSQHCPHMNNSLQLNCILFLHEQLVYPQYKIKAWNIHTDTSDNKENTSFITVVAQF